MPPLASYASVTPTIKDRAKYQEILEKCGSCIPCLSNANSYHYFFPMQETDFHRIRVFFSRNRYWHSLASRKLFQVRWSSARGPKVFGAVHYSNNLVQLQIKHFSTIMRAFYALMPSNTAEHFERVKVLSRRVWFSVVYLNCHYLLQCRSSTKEIIAFQNMFSPFYCFPAALLSTYTLNISFCKILHAKQIHFEINSLL